MSTAENELRLRRSFEDVALPHLDAAYNLAKWLLRSPQDAEDVVQDAFLRAFKAFAQYHGGDARSWILKIVRNASYTLMEKNRPAKMAVEFDETIHVPEKATSDAETQLLRSADSETLRKALSELPVNFREVLVLRELEDMSYKQIAEVTGVPIGTVMSGLARGRAQLRQRLLTAKEGLPRG